MGSIIFHIDANSAYLSWIAISNIQKGGTLDLRNVPSVVGGDVESRHGIVLAKSIPAKKYNIITGEPIYKAISKCKNLIVVPPNYNIFMKCSNAMANILGEYSPMLQRFSVDECFLDMTHFKDNYMEKAEEIKSRIYRELGFTVNIGISTNKLLAKMASDFQKPNRIHTLFPEEIKEKMWPLPVEDLFMVGSKTKPKLNKLNINTIGELANYDYNILISIFKSFGKTLHEYANGIDKSEVRKSNYLGVKGIGNSITISKDLTNKEEALKILLSLTETTAARLRASKNLCGLVVVSIKTNNFISYSHQKQLNNYTDSTNIIFNGIKKAFNECYKGEAIRHLGVRVTNFTNNDFYQSSLFEEKNIEKYRSLDKTVDNIRKKYGGNAVIRSTFLHSGIKPLSGGNGEDDYLFMSSIL
ncbi:MAG: DNA polymerase IV [Clostridiales bacterium]|nr:DNA polymerase IV [Clostridiales bacterium]